MVNTPSFKLYCLRGAFGGFRDDNFITGWVSGAGMSLTTNNDTGTFTSIVGTPHNSLKATPAIATATYKFVTVKGHCPNTAFTLDFLDTASTVVGTITFTASHATDEILQVTLTAGNGTLGTVRITGGAVNDTCLVDWIYVGSKAYLDLTKYMRGYTTSWSLGWQGSEARFEIQDEAGLLEFGTFQLTPVDVLILYESLNGTTFYRAWGGPLREIDKHSATGRRITSLVVNGWDKALEAVEAYVYKGSQSDISIVGALVDTLNTGRIVPGISGWNLAKNLNTVTGVTDAAFVWAQVDIRKALTDLSDYCSIKIAGNGADFWVSHAEVMNWYPINAAALQAAFSLTDDDFYELDLNFHVFDLRTEVAIIGVGQFPISGDDWTDNVIADVWTNETNITHSQDTTARTNRVGNSVLKITTSSNTNIHAGVFTTFTAIDFTTLGASTQNSMPTLNFTFGIPSTDIDSIDIILESSANNYFLAHIPAPLVFTGVNLVPISLPLVTASGKAGNNTIQWQPNGTPLWTAINKMYIRINATNSVNGDTAVIDNLHFEFAAIEIAVDGRTGKGEAAFGRRELTMVDPMPQPVTNGIALNGTGVAGPGIREKAFAELKKWRDPITSGYAYLDMDVFNAAHLESLAPGSTLQISSPTHYPTLSSVLRIISVSHRWQQGDNYITVTLEVTDFLTNTMSRQPKDIFRQIKQFHALSQGDFQEMILQASPAYGGQNLIGATVKIYTA